MQDLQEEILRTAAQAVEIFVLYGKRLTPALTSCGGIMICDEENFSGWKINPYLLNNKSGCYVELSVNGIQRGLMGTSSPSKKNLAEEIISSAISAASQDPFQQPVSAEELSSLSCRVFIPGTIRSFLYADKDTQDFALHPQNKKFSFLVQKGYRSGLSLPCDGKNYLQQIQEAIKKADTSIEEMPAFFSIETAVFQL